MSRNFSSRGFPLHPNLFSIGFHLPLGMDCLLFSPSSVIFFTYNLITIFFLLPICIFILYRGLQEWWKKHSTSSTAPMSHSDCFPYHTVIVDLIGTFGCIICSCGLYIDNLIVILVGGTFYSFIWSGPCSDMCGALPGSCSSHHLPQPKKRTRNKNQKFQHWMCLALLLCKGGCSDVRHRL